MSVAPAAVRHPFLIAGQQIAPGTRAKLELPIARLVSGTPVAVPVLVLHGRDSGPTLWLTAAVHGDELCGVDIIRRVLSRLDPATMAGTVIAVPVVNVHGFNTGDRYLPDRRDLNRSFPGSTRGSLASRIAHLIMTEIIGPADVGIDLHTGSDHRVNLPQIRADLDDPATLELARVFGAPVAVHSRTRDGSLRQAATDAGCTVLLYEAGEADRFDEHAIRAGTDGVLRVLRFLGMWGDGPEELRSIRLSRSTRWVRSPRSGILHLDTTLGDQVVKGQVLATVHDPFGVRLGTLNARAGGLIIGHTQRALVNRGDAVVHVADVVDVVGDMPLEGPPQGGDRGAEPNGSSGS